MLRREQDPIGDLEGSPIHELLCNSDKRVATLLSGTKSKYIVNARNARMYIVMHTGVTIANYHHPTTR